MNDKGEADLEKLRQEMNPVLQKGEYVFTSVKDLNNIDRAKTICEFKEDEGITVIISKKEADKLSLQYNYIASWIILKVHSSLEAIGLTALFSGELAKHNISCNVVAGYYHDHIFVDIKDSKRAIQVLNDLSNS